MSAVLIALFALGITLAAWRIARPGRGEVIDWNAPARDLTGADDAYDSAKAMMRGAPVVWSDAVAPGGYVCAARIDHLPGGICGWPAESEPCPQHGPLLLPGGGR